VHAAKLRKWPAAVAVVGTAAAVVVVAAAAVAAAVVAGKSHYAVCNIGHPPDLWIRGMSRLVGVHSKTESKGKNTGDAARLWAMALFQCR
jgi:hypothetical protein